ncbi:ABC transporter substrate-binding protein [Desulfonema magnum]|uniref:Glycine betaine/proline betaine transport system, substrate-binding protein n=1 Tax=Desulfonema magnum TaxID=45655 RepID=A0A975BIG1_9BACT|nr:ABC transporter substrate-binding protein [Desulfonema magnum]QTA85913.1 Glycine betaine/proline betaine transport system, substrate-binding protein [Desulfonema magnum]
MKNKGKQTVIRISFVSMIVCLILLFSVSMAAAKTKIVIGDLAFDSAYVNDRIVKFIAEKGMGYEVELMPGDSIMLIAGLRKGDVDVIMEVWVENNQKIYDQGIAEGAFIDLGSNFSDSWQGFLVPTYIIKGDPERGIKPVAPDLKSVYDMAKYWKVFKDPEDPSKGRFYSCIPGWGCEKVNRAKFKAYGLDKHYNLFLPGSDAALSGSMAGAYKKGKPWFGYYWAPTWPLGEFDMTPLEEPAFDEKVWNETKGCAYPAVKVNIAVHKAVPEKAPDLVEFLKKYETTQEICNKFLSYMKNSNAKAEDAAIWFLKNYETLWTQWVSEDVAKKVKAALK